MPNVRFIALPYKMSLYVTWRKNDNCPVLKVILQQVSKAVSKYVTEGNEAHF